MLLFASALDSASRSSTAFSACTCPSSRSLHRVSASPPSLDSSLESIPTSPTQRVCPNRRSPSPTLGLVWTASLCTSRERARWSRLRSSSRTPKKLALLWSCSNICA
ncbi:hypothetical protein BLNAU_10875 [Blattamonas nauphoetae]|uniref:Secreted protein n=1 Tax=Blattamonas nauphoetae TaxID=2049346 RepID=A0ABQ9XSZ9_9EUKA|nr:hypothetical protein BLNAU_10875 [Blattamonas nauphoetae]